MTPTRYLLVILASVTYVVFLVLYFQHSFFDDYIIRTFNTQLDTFVTETICNPQQTKENLATQSGRIDQEFPSPRCCQGVDCLQPEKPSIILTTLRNDEYLPLLKSLVCTFRQSNLNATLAVATVEGDLSQVTLLAVKDLNVEIIIWKELKFPNTKSPRFALNWVKIRAWEMSQYDSILMVDADTVILGDVTHLFRIPTAFATVLDQDKSNPRFSSLGRMQGGVVLLRPCPAVAQHMISLLEQHEFLRFSSGHAEQSFFDW